MGDFNKQVQGLSDEGLTDEITRIAVEYQAISFPNPDRKNCPNNEYLMKIAVSDELPNDELRTHLLNCSPCFNEFRKIRQDKASSGGKVKAEAKKFYQFSFLFNPVPAFLTLLLVAGGIVVVFYLVTANRRDEIANHNATILPTNVNNQTETAAQQDNQHKISSKDVTENSVDSDFNAKSNLTDINKKADDVTLKNKRVEKADGQNLVAKNIVKIDLSKSTVFRSNGSKEISYTLPSSPVKINIKFPTNYPSGKYTVSLLDEYGKTLIADQNISSNGKNAAFSLNLKNIHGSARLCLAPKGETPDCVAVKIGDAP